MNWIFLILVLNSGKFAYSYRYSTKLVIKNRFSGATPIAVGTENFVELLQNSDLFFDKTPLLHHLFFIDFNVKAIYLPTKWGKSTNLHMMKIFFEISVDEQGTSGLRNMSESYRLFKYGEIPNKNGAVENLKKGLKISGWDTFKNSQGQYPVIYIRLGNLYATTFAEFLNVIGDRIRSVYIEHSYLKTVLEENAHQRSYYQSHYLNFTKILEKQYDPELLTNSLKALSELQYDHFKRKVFALVDDFENILFNLLVNSDIAETEIKLIISFYSNLLVISFRENRNLRYSVLMGTFRVMNLISTDDEYKEFKELKATNTPTRRIYAISKNEQAELFNYLKLPPEVISRMLSWYEGYLSDDLLSGTYLNPYSLAKFLATEELQFDQTGSYGDRLLTAILKHKSFRNSILCLIDGKIFLGHYRSLKRDDYFEDYIYFRRHIHQGDDIDFHELNIWNLFNYCGYLTIVEHIGCKGSHFRIPNNEMRMEISRKLMNYYIDRFNVSSTAIENAVHLMTRFVTSDETKPVKLIEFLQSIIDNDVLIGDVAKANQEYVESHATLKIIRFFITYLTLRVVLVQDYQTEPMLKLQYREEEMRSVRVDSIMNNTDQAVFILINNKAPSARRALEIVKTLQEVKRYTQIDNVKFVGINIVANRVIDIEAQSMKNPFKN